jgi:hypothetical protein
VNRSLVPGATLCNLIYGNALDSGTSPFSQNSVEIRDRRRFSGGGITNSRLLEKRFSGRETNRVGKSSRTLLWPGSNWRQTSEIS